MGLEQELHLPEQFSITATSLVDVMGALFGGQLQRSVKDGLCAVCRRFGRTWGRVRSVFHGSQDNQMCRLLKLGFRSRRLTCRGKPGLQFFVIGEKRATALPYLDSRIRLVFLFVLVAKPGIRPGEVWLRGLRFLVLNQRRNCSITSRPLFN